MSNHAEIRDLMSLVSLKEKLSRYNELTFNDLFLIERAIEKRMSHLSTLRSQYRSQLHRAEFNYEEAKFSLNRCREGSEDSYGDDYTENDCSEYEYLKEEAYQELAIAREKDSIADVIYRSVVNQSNTFKPAIKKLRLMLKNRGHEAVKVLGLLINGAEDYIAIQSNDGRGSGGSSSRKITVSLPPGAPLSALPHSQTVNIGKFTFKESKKGKNKFQVFYQEDNASDSARLGGEILIRNEGGKKVADIHKLSSMDLYPEISNTLLKRLERNARQAGCSQISFWAEGHMEINRFKKLGYEPQNIQKSPMQGEMVKYFGNTGFEMVQKKAERKFRDFNQKAWLFSEPKIEKSIDPSRILAPDQPTGFWSHHGRKKEDYHQLINNLQEVLNIEASYGDDSTEVLEAKPLLKDARAKFYGRSSISLIEFDGYFMAESGLHRVAAAHEQIKAGKSPVLVASVKHATPK
jgi:hypothetical protein